MSFSFKVAPGIRIRASSRGVRTSVGPRIARVHVGGGRTGISTGAGPVSFYTSLSGGSRRRCSSSGGRSRTVAASQRAVAQAAKQQAAEQLRTALQEILNLHRQDFETSSPPQAPPPPPVDTAAVVAEHEARALVRIGRFKRSERKQARASAAVSAQQEVAQLEEQRQQEWRQMQDQVDHWWAALLCNDPEVVLSVLGEAFEDNEAPAAAVGIDGSDVALVVLAPSIEMIPERKPDRTPAGNLTLKKLTKGERASFHSTAVASHVLLTVKETLAVAPALSACRIVAIQHAGNDSYGQPRVDVLMAARFERGRLHGVMWNTTAAVRILSDTATELVANFRKTTGEMQPINLDREPEIEGLLRQLEVEDLVARS